MSGNDGGPATPIIVISSDINQRRVRDMLGELGNVGLTVRDEFAKAALQGYLSSFGSTKEPAEYAGTIAADCFKLADAMMLERMK